MNENKPRVVVLGGSFNPPTTAHRALLLHAMRHAHANEGVFVPSSDAYVTRKATRARTPRIFSEAERLDMLLAMTEDEPGLDVSTCEYGDTSSGRSYLTMRDVQREHPDAECCFIVGADKLHVIPRWRSIGAFMDEFKFVVLSRAEDDHGGDPTVLDWTFDLMTAANWIGRPKCVTSKTIFAFAKAYDAAVDAGTLPEATDNLLSVMKPIDPVGYETLTTIVYNGKERRSAMNALTVDVAMGRLIASDLLPRLVPAIALTRDD